LPWIIFYADILKPSLPLVILVAFAWVYTLINLVQTYFFYCSRIRLAWAGDSLMPDLVGYVHPRLRTPIIAMLIVAIIAQIGVVDAAQGGVIGAQLNFVFFAVCAQLVPVVAATFFPYLNKEWFNASNGFVKLKILKLPVITIVGIITLIYLIWLIVSSFVYPIVAGPIKLSNLFTLAIFILSGVAWFSIRAAYLKRSGRNLWTVFRTLPQN
jgi:amino acid transporter